MEIFNEFVNFVKVIVYISFLNSILFLDKKKLINKWLIVIVSVCFFTEIFNSLLVVLKVSLGFFNTISIIFHNLFWIILLSLIFKFKIQKIWFSIYLFICLINILFIQGFQKFNTYTFLFSAIIYLVILISKNINILRLEKLDIFKTNKYLLSLSPILFFIGLGLMFSFKSKTLVNLQIFNEIKLYTFINYFVNTIYYALINIYIFKERKLKNA